MDISKRAKSRDQYQSNTVSKIPALSSNVLLVDASLDPHDSPYEQIAEDGQKKIRYKGQQ
jgi:hypothetical protein